VGGETRYVVEKQQTYPDGRVRLRTMLVAEKRRPGEAWSACALRGLDEELGAAGRVVAESYRAFEEEKRSPLLCLGARVPVKSRRSGPTV